MAVVSAAGLLLGSGGLYRLHPALSLGVTEAEAGLLLPGLLGQDVFNLLVGLPLLLGSPWLARRGALIGLLFYVPLVTLSAFTTISLVSSIDGEKVWRRLSGAVPARVIGAILVVLGLLTLAQDASGALITVPLTMCQRIPRRAVCGLSTLRCRR
jgi:hypothetical protein